MNVKYSKAEQSKYLRKRTWEDNRRDEFLPTIGLSVLVICFVAAGFHVLNGMADWAVGLGA